MHRRQIASRSRGDSAVEEARLGRRNTRLRTSRPTPPAEDGEEELIPDGMATDEAAPVATNVGPWGQQFLATMNARLGNDLAAIHAQSSAQVVEFRREALRSCLRSLARFRSRPSVCG